MTTDRLLLNDELVALGCQLLVQVAGQTPYRVDPQYFAVAHDQIMTGAFLSSIRVKNPFLLPANYFANFSDKLLHSVFQNGSIASPFTVDASYFDNLSTNILDRIKREAVSEETPVVAMNATKEKKKAKVFSLYKKVSVAAAVLLGLSIGGKEIYSFAKSKSDYNHAVGTNLNTALDGISDEELADYLNESTQKNIDNITPISVDPYKELIEQGRESDSID